MSAGQVSVDIECVVVLTSCLALADRVVEALADR
jgi:hypothetical protein